MVTLFDLFGNNASLFCCSGGAKWNINAKIVENLYVELVRIGGKAVTLRHAKNRRKYKLLTKA